MNSFTDRLFRLVIVGAGLTSCLVLQAPTARAVQWEAGFSKIDVTPTSPVRTSGYGSRNHPSEGVETPLHVRAVCLRERSSQASTPPLLLISADNIGLSGELTRDLATQIGEKHSIDRARIVFSSTHTHSGPDLGEQLSNIFTVPLSEEERQAAQNYRQKLRESITTAAAEAIANLAPASLSYGLGQASFAANRRVLKDGKWSGFGVQADGPVDHTVPVIRITDPSGNVRGILFNYACHCTTVGGDYYKINADWAGYAATRLENTFAGATALCTIGCGADANPNPRGSVEMAEMHGEVLADEVARLVGGDLQPITESAETHFDYAALSFDLPTREELEQRLSESNVQSRRHAERLIRIYQEKHRLPATYPVPIQSWKFGDQLTMVFLGGEVVVDYALRLKKVFDDPQLWVSAYCNDVLGYIASERMIAEGGYEYDRSGVYYSLPGPWASGTEDLLIRRVVELIEQRGRAKPLSTDASLNSLQVAEGYRVELVAAEPLIRDPVNLAFGSDGRLWVVEMGDYPEGEGGGSVKTLTDTDGDGTFDRATTFLSGIGFPTGVQPWGDGVLISAAPEILWAADTDGDGVADEKRVVYSGFPLANPQHRINGFTYGLDHSLHLASGDNLGDITSSATGQTLNARGHDLKIFPDSGRMQTTSGRTQFVRSRDSFGHWFGNSNSRPMFQFPIEDHYLKRNANVSYSSNTQSLFTPATAPRVYPRTSASERFNDLFAANRFTSACSSIIACSPYFQFDGDESLFVCEPVHNLVHRSVLRRHGATFRAERTPSESESEFLASTDPWFRPVRATIGPDGMLYVVDMYREVIEHPEWIPDSWQARLDLRAGERYGRIYRVVPDSEVPSPTAPLDKLTRDQLWPLLGSPIGPLRDQVQMRLISTMQPEDKSRLTTMLHDANGWHRLHALSILHAKNWLDGTSLRSVLNDPEAGVLSAAIRYSEPLLEKSPELLALLSEHANHSDLSVVLQVALAAGATTSPQAGIVLAKIASRPDLDRWIADAVVSSCVSHSVAIADSVFQLAETDPTSLTPVRLEMLRRVILTGRMKHSETLDDLIAGYLASDHLPLESRLKLAQCAVNVERKSKELSASLTAALDPLRRSAQQLAEDESQSETSRCLAVSLVSLNAEPDSRSSEFLFSLLTPQTPTRLQCQALEGLLRSVNSEKAETLFDRWPELSNQVRQHAISQLTSTGNGARLLIEGLEQGKISVNDLSLSVRQQIAMIGDRSLKVRATRILNRNQSVEKSVLVRQYLAAFESEKAQTAEKRDGELKHGRELFEKHCATCHRPSGEHQPIGANLNNLSNRSDEALVRAILDPNQAVEPKYQNYVLQTDEGKTLAGVIESEVADSVTLAHADGKRTSIRRNQIERIQATGTSLMPEGFETTLDPKALQAIVRYLQQPQ